MVNEEIAKREAAEDAPRQNLIEKLKTDPLYFIESKENFLKFGETFLKIKDRKTDKIIPWKCNNSQHMLLNSFFKFRAEQIPVRLVVLKGRQQGCSTGVGAIGFTHMMCHIGANLLIATETKQDSGKNIYDMYRRYKNHFPIQLPVTHEVSGQLIQFGEQMNDAYIAVTGERRVVSRTIKFIHLSEAAKFENLNRFMDDMTETVPMHVMDTSIFVESTAEEYGDMFHELWEAAKIGSREGHGWQQLFIPWWVHEEYGEDEPYNQFKSKAERNAFEASLNDSPDAMYGDEVSLLGLKSINIPISPGETREVGVTLENLKWRRAKISEKSFSLVDFYRQYPSTAEEAFRAATLSPLDQQSLAWYTDNRVYYPEKTSEDKPHPKAGEMRKPAQIGEFFEKDEVSNTFDFIEVQHAIVVLWELVRQYGEYIIGVDMAQGIETGDFSCAVVLSRLPFRVVARLRGLDGRRLDPNEFARQLFALGKYYNNAMICPENNADGGSLIRDLVNWNYPNLVREETITGNSAGNRYGWNNNGQTHKRMVAKLQEVIREKSIDIKDEVIVEECKHMVYRPGRGGGIQAAKKGQKRRPGSLQTGYYDDTVFALGGALLLDSVLPYPKTDKQLENEARVQRLHNRVRQQKRQEFDENSWLDMC